MIPIDVGSVLGPVELRSVIRKDETSTVYSAHHARLNAEVNVRVMYGSPAADRARFLREARISATLKHPALVRVLDFGEFADARYIVTQPIRGTTLQYHLAESKEPPSETAIVQLLLQVADTLRICHNAGVAHRDLRPSSLLRDLKGRLKVLDVGFVPSSGSPLRSPDGSIASFSPYLPHEFAHCEAPIPPSADIFALGIIGYELAFRCLPFDFGDMAAEDLEEIPAPARFDLPTHCSAEFVQILRELIAPDPSARIDTAAELLQRLRAHSGIHTRSPGGEGPLRAAAAPTRRASKPIASTSSRKSFPLERAVSISPEKSELVAPAHEEGPRFRGLAMQPWLDELQKTVRAVFVILADQRHEIELLPPSMRRRIVVWGTGLAIVAAGAVSAGVALILR